MRVTSNNHWNCTVKLGSVLICKDCTLNNCYHGTHDFDLVEKVASEERDRIYKTSCEKQVDFESKANSEKI